VPDQPPGAPPATTLAPLSDRDLALGDDVRQLSFPKASASLVLGTYAALLLRAIAVATLALAALGYAFGAVHFAIGALFGGGFMWLFSVVVRRLIRHVTATWDDHDLVIATWPQRRGRRLPRADAAEVRHLADGLVVRTRAGDDLPLVDGDVTSRDAASGRLLAAALGVPYVDEAGEVLPLPTARIHRPD